MKFRPISDLLSIPVLCAVAAGVAGCTTVENIDCGNGSFCAEPAGGMIFPEVVSKTGSTVSCDFGRVITARPVIRVTGPAKTEIKYRTCSNAADAAESAFELPDPGYHEQAGDLMGRIALITATYESTSVRKFRFLDIELPEATDILKVGARAVTCRNDSSTCRAASPHQQGQPSTPWQEDP